MKKVKCRIVVEWIEEERVLSPESVLATRRSPIVQLSHLLNKEVVT